MALHPGVTAVIPTIPPRADYLRRALDSIHAQTRPVTGASIYVDHQHIGAAAARNRALAAVDTEYSAFLDDDDEWRPEHILTLVKGAAETGADVVYPWFDVVSSRAFDPWPGVFGRPFDPDDLRQRNYIPVTVLARTELVRDVGGFEPYGDQQESACDDWGLWRKLLAAGARFHHAPARTWLWHWHGEHTSGLPDRW